MNQQIKAIVKDLYEEKNLLTEQIQNLENSGMEDNLTGATSELSLYDNHPADLGTEVFERSKDLALRDNALVLLKRVEAAIERVREGTYGQCTRCGKSIPWDRLQALPWAEKCVDCAQEIDDLDKNGRPVEEELLEPPFHRTFTDETEFQFVGFDGEDSLQAVLKYGSSDSPQDIPGSYNYKALFPNSNEHQGIVERSDAIPNRLLGKDAKKK